MSSENNPFGILNTVLDQAREYALGGKAALVFCRTDVEVLLGESLDSVYDLGFACKELDRDVVAVRALLSQLQAAEHYFSFPVFQHRVDAPAAMGAAVIKAETMGDYPRYVMVVSPHDEDSGLYALSGRRNVEQVTGCKGVAPRPCSLTLIDEEKSFAHNHSLEIQVKGDRARLDGLLDSVGNVDKRCQS